jgi:hypothetical protein
MAMLDRHQAAPMPGVRTPMPGHPPRARRPRAGGGGAGAVAEAQQLARAGLAVFPCHAGKAPATPRGFHDAAREPDAVAQLWRRHPGPLIGVATGEASGIAVLDIDHQHGGAAWWEAHRGRLPVTRAHRTRSGGLHLVFRHRAGLRCSVARIARGVDVRAEGGCVIWWPAAGLPVLETADFAAWPEWLANLAAPPPPPPPPPAPFKHVGRYAAAAIRRAVEHVAGTAEGGRNHALNAETFSLMRLVREGLLGQAEILSAMTGAGLASGLGQREVERTVTGAMRRGGVR